MGKQDLYPLRARDRKQCLMKTQNPYSRDRWRVKKAPKWWGNGDNLWEAIEPGCRYPKDCACRPFRTHREALDYAVMAARFDDLTGLRS